MVQPTRCACVYARNDHIIGLTGGVTLLLFLLPLLQEDPNLPGVRMTSDGKFVVPKTGDIPPPYVSTAY